MLDMQMHFINAYEAYHVCLGRREQGIPRVLVLDEELEQEEHEHGGRC